MSLVYLRKSFKLDLPEGELSHGGELLPGGITGNWILDAETFLKIFEISG